MAVWMGGGQVHDRDRTLAMDADDCARICAQYAAVCENAGISPRTSEDARALLEELLEGEPERVKRRLHSANRSRGQIR